MESKKEFVSEEINEIIPENKFDVIVIGGGQAGLSLGFYLRRANLRQNAPESDSDFNGRPG